MMTHLSHISFVVYLLLLFSFLLFSFLLLRTLRSTLFPYTTLFRSEAEISDELRAHFRYPQDMFKVQRSILARYHVDDPRVFFNNDAFWSVPADPTGADQEDLDQPPYYVVASDSETGEPAFQLISSLRGLSREFLSAHMTASSDPESYGDITVRVLPTDTQTQGPKQAQDAMMSSDQVARDMTLWRGSYISEECRVGLYSITRTRHHI